MPGPLEPPPDVGTEVDPVAIEIDIVQFEAEYLCLPPTRQEKRRDELQEKVNFAHQASANLNAKLDTSRSRLDQMVERAFEIDQELEDLREELVNAETEIQDAKTRLDQAERSLETAEIRRESLVEERDDMRTELEEVRCEAKEDREKVHDVALKVESKRSLRESTQNGMERMVGQLAQKARSNAMDSDASWSRFGVWMDSLPLAPTKSYRSVSMMTRMIFMAPIIHHSSLPFLLVAYTIGS